MSQRDFEAFHAGIHGAFSPNPALQAALAAAAKVKRA
jgi:hypothetical protein